MLFSFFSCPTPLTHQPLFPFLERTSFKRVCVSVHDVGQFSKHISKALFSLWRPFWRRGRVLGKGNRVALKKNLMSTRKTISEGKPKANNLCFKAIFPSIHVLNFRTDLLALLPLVWWIVADKEEEGEGRKTTFGLMTAQLS